MTTSPPEPGPDALEQAAAVVEQALDPIEERALQHLDHPRRMVLVHAHPDDETTATGITIAHYAASGAEVTLVTCTRGEQGEVLVPDLAHLHADHDDALGDHRVTELATAMEALGVTDFRFLGQPGEYRDSGMAGEPSNDHPAAFAKADVDEAATRLVRVLREVRPQVLITYDAKGGYEHPDHVQAHRVAMRAVELAADPGVGPGEPWRVAKVYWPVIPASGFREGLRRLREAGDDAFAEWDPDGELPPMFVPDEAIHAVVTAPEQLSAKVAAWRAYATQVDLDSPFFRLASSDTAAMFSAEHFVLAQGTPAPDPDEPHGWETDLFAGTS